MKTPEEWVSKYFVVANLTGALQNMYIEIFSAIQKDAYNQALFDLADDDLLPDKQKNLIKYMK